MSLVNCNVSLVNYNLGPANCNVSLVNCDLGLANRNCDHNSITIILSLIQINIKIAISMSIVMVISAPITIAPIIISIHIIIQTWQSRLQL